MTMTMQDILVFQTNWPDNIDIMYSEKSGMACGPHQLSDTQKKKR